MPSRPLRIGTAGWTIPARYSDAVPGEGSHLQRYANALNAAEINSSFHRSHQPKTYQRWAASTPPDFRFSVKLPRTVTHDHALAGCRELLRQFADEVAGLGDKLAIVLMQLPPKFAFDRRVVGRFLTELNRHFHVPVVCEPRHASWFAPEVDAWLAKRQVARVAADPARVTGADAPGGWDGLLYCRWHGSPRIYYSEYDEAALEALQRRLEAARSRKVESWCIFDNTASGAALGNALALAERLSGEVSPRRAAD